MKVDATDLPGVLRIEPDVFGDERGYFMESWNLARYRQAGIEASFVQSNVSRSQRGVLRGLHFQTPNPQGKLVWVLEGEVFDVALDVRRGSPTFGQWVGEVLSLENRYQFWVPPGFAHGFCVTSESALFCYLCTTPYDGPSDRGVRWDDPELGIDWPVATPSLSAKDAAAPVLSAFEAALLPVWAPPETSGGDS